MQQIKILCHVIDFLVEYISAYNSDKDINDTAYSSDYIIYNTADSTDN